jgi:hypothetical protein
MRQVRRSSDARRLRQRFVRSGAEIASHVHDRPA